MEVGSVGLASNADVLRAGHTIQSCGGACDELKECLHWRLLEGLSAKRTYEFHASFKVQLVWKKSATNPLVFDAANIKLLGFFDMLD